MPDRTELFHRLAVESAVGESADVVICERDPRRFISAVTDAIGSGGNVFIADPDWDDARRAIFNELRASRPVDGAERGWLCLPTGGSGGGVKLARHDEATLAAAAHGFSRHFGVTRVNALGLLPLHHVSGFMAWMRTVLTGGQYQPADWSEIFAGQRPPLAPGDWFVSLVPTQLARLLADPEAVDWLRQFRAILIGGGPAWPALLDQAAAENLPVSFVYGSTETGAMVSALRPAEFIKGLRDCGLPLPHVRLSLAADGRLQVESESLFHGYWPHSRPDGSWVTDDLAEIDSAGRLTILGRSDGFIISGGKKVNPLTVEAVIRATGRWADVVVIGVPDAEWGQRVVACHSHQPGPHPDVDIEPAMRAHLLPAERPKTYLAVHPWPRNAQGKVDRAALAEKARLSC